MRSFSMSTVGCLCGAKSLDVYSVELYFEEGIVNRLRNLHLNDESVDF